MNDRAKNLGLSDDPDANFADWYQEIVAKAELAERGPAKGSMVIRPYGYRMWELIQQTLDGMFKATGHENAYFPLLIPQSYMTREAEHVEGFAPELAVVTHGGGKELEEPLVVRPTSEMVIGEMMAKWITSHRDLPLLLNQWANVVRWELRPRLFLRTTEFLWQEGHTAHADEEDARRETMQMLDVYVRFSRDWAAIPVVHGPKTPTERFAGAVDTYTIEGMMRDGKALQCGTSHYLGTNFAKAFDMTFQNKQNTAELCHTTSWGMTTRMIGAMIMAHGDAKGLVLPPRLAPHQVVLVPVMSHKDDRISPECDRIAAELTALGVRAHVDHRDATPGFKLNDWELKGVPFRIELGPRDLDEGNVTLSQRLDEIPSEDGRPIKTSVAIAEAVAGMPARLDAYHEFLLTRAEDFRDANTKQVDTWDEFAEQVKSGWASVFYDGTPETEARIKEATSATPRVIPIDGPEETGACFVTGNPSAFGKRVVFSRAY